MRYVILVLCCVSYAVTFANLDSSTNLAAGKKVIFSVEPESSTGVDTAYKLTDGILVQNPGGINLSDDAVYWQWNAYTISDQVGVNMVIDLGEIKQLKKSNIRVFGNSSFARHLRLPKRVTLLVSKNGQDFYRVKAFYKITTYGQGENSDKKEYFYADEIGKAIPYNFEFELDNISARYVGVNILSDFFYLYADEWQIWGSEENCKPKEEVYNPQNRTHFGLDGLLAERDSVYFGPLKQHGFSVCENAVLPTVLHYVDYRPGGSWRDLSFIMELPDEIQLVRNKLISFHHISERNFTRDGEKYRKITIKVNEQANNKPWIDKDFWPGRIVKKMGQQTHSYTFGPLYFKINGELTSNNKCFFYTEEVEEATNSNENKKRAFTPAGFTADIFNLPSEVDFHASPVVLAWMWELYSSDWPDFLTNYPRIGFNMFPAFPMYYVDKEQYDIQEDILKFYKRVRENGLNIAMVDSAFHTMNLQPEDADKVSCQGVETRLCPSYRGKYYLDVLKRIRKCVSSVDPDYIFFDIELFSGIKAKVKDCSRCTSLANKQNVSIEDYLVNCGTRMARDVSRATGEYKVGLYHVCESGGVYQDVFSFDKIYPDYINLSQKPLYIGGQLDTIHCVAQDEYRLLKEKWRAFPWITTGTYGEYPSFKIELMIYELILNGNGVAFFCFVDFDNAKEYYYVAKSLKNLEPYQHILETGNPDLEWKVDNELISSSAFKTDKEGLFLVGNYVSGTEEYVKPNLPFNDISLIRDVCRDKIVSIYEFENQIIKPQQIGLFYVKSN
ncbi:MAG: hypothetical protein ACIAQZ_11745 [Sedimentisphaeraceae bacterium JB056]